MLNNNACRAETLSGCPSRAAFLLCVCLLYGLVKSFSFSVSLNNSPLKWEIKPHQSPDKQTEYMEVQYSVRYPSTLLVI